MRRTTRTTTGRLILISHSHHRGDTASGFTLPAHTTSATQAYRTQAYRTGPRESVCTRDIGTCAERGPSVEWPRARGGAYIHIIGRHAILSCKHDNYSTALYRTVTSLFTSKTEPCEIAKIYMWYRICDRMKNMRIGRTGYARATGHAREARVECSVRQRHPEAFFDIDEMT